VQQARMWIKVVRFHPYLLDDLFFNYPLILFFSFFSFLLENKMSNNKLKIDEVSKDTSGVGTKDAFHFPAIQVVSNNIFKPGEKIRLGRTEDGNQFYTMKCNIYDYHAIVSPVLKNDVKSGEVFWAFLNPDLVDVFTHNFEIKGFPELKEKVKEVTKYINSYDDDECGRCYN